MAERRSTLANIASMLGKRSSGKDTLVLTGLDVAKNIASYGFDVRETIDSASKSRVLIVVRVKADSDAQRVGMVSGQILRTFVFNNGGKEMKVPLTSVSELILTLQKAGPNPKMKVIQNDLLLKQALEEMGKEPTAPLVKSRSREHLDFVKSNSLGRIRSSSIGTSTPLGTPPLMARASSWDNLPGEAPPVALRQRTESSESIDSINSFTESSGQFSRAVAPRLPSMAESSKEGADTLIALGLMTTPKMATTIEEKTPADLPATSATDADDLQGDRPTLRRFDSSPAFTRADFGVQLAKNEANKPQSAPSTVDDGPPPAVTVEDSGGGYVAFNGNLEAAPPVFSKAPSASDIGAEPPARRSAGDVSQDGAGSSPSSSFRALRGSPTGSFTRSFAGNDAESSSLRSYSSSHSDMAGHAPPSVAHAAADGDPAASVLSSPSPSLSRPLDRSQVASPATAPFSPTLLGAPTIAFTPPPTATSSAPSSAPASPRLSMRSSASSVGSLPPVTPASARPSMMSPLSKSSRLDGNSPTCDGDGGPASPSGTSAALPPSLVGATGAAAAAILAGRWYLPKASSSVAEMLLINEAPGAFLVRGSTSVPGTYALAVRNTNRVEHMSISRFESTGQYFLSKTKHFDSVLALVDYYVRNSLETHFKSVNTSLIKPLGVTTFLTTLEESDI